MYTTTSEDEDVRLGLPWWKAGGSGRSLVGLFCGGSAGGTSWALPARLWAAPGQQGWWSVPAPGTILGCPREGPILCQQALGHHILCVYK